MNAHVVESTSELSAFMKAGVMAGSERDAGFCSGGDEDDMSGLHSPSASEDSVEVQVTPISLRNKRKLAEPRKIREQSTAPLKKRRRFEVETETEISLGDEESRPAGTPSPGPFRPWSHSSAKVPVEEVKTAKDLHSTVNGEEETEEDIAQKRRKEEDREREAEEESRRRIQEEVLQRLQARSVSPNQTITSNSSSPPSSSASSTSSSQRRDRFEASFQAPPPLTTSVPHPRLQEEPLSLVLRGEVPRVPCHPAVNGSYERTSMDAMERLNSHSNQTQQTTQSTSSRDHSHSHTHSHSHNHSHNHHHQNRHQHQHEHQHHPTRHHMNGGQQRNYKNMTRERRIEANARERTRVHTISAAFDTLRKAIPAYSHNQKLSKLSVLRIACSYIMTLSKLVDNEPDTASNASLGACVDLVSRTIQTEGKLRKKKDE